MNYNSRQVARPPGGGERGGRVVGTTHPRIPWVPGPDYGHEIHAGVERQDELAAGMNLSGRKEVFREKTEEKER